MVGRRAAMLATMAVLVLPVTAKGESASSSHVAAASRVTASKVTVPNLHCRRLDRAEDTLRSRGLRVRVRGGGFFGIVVKSNWVVQSQTPRAGSKVSKGRRVTLYVDRSC